MPAMNLKALEKELAGFKYESANVVRLLTTVQMSRIHSYSHGEVIQVCFSSSKNNKQDNTSIEILRI